VSQLSAYEKFRFREGYMENPSSKNFQVAEFILALKQIFEFVKKDFPGLYINTEDH